MDKNDFELLLASAQEALAIAKGEMSPARVFTHEVEIPDVQAIRKKQGLVKLNLPTNSKSALKPYKIGNKADENRQELQLCS